MFQNYLKIAYRNLLKYKAYSLTNVFGLAIGIAATMMILLFIQFELSYEKFHQNAKSLYRVSVVHKKEAKVQFDSPVFTPPLGPAMAKDFPEVESFARFSTRRVAYLSHNDRALKIDGIRHADSTLFDLFSFELIAGNPSRALANPYSIVLTEETSERIFGAQNPMGELVKLDNEESYLVTGIVKSPPANSHILFNALISFSTLYKDPNLYLDWNGGNQYTAYVKLAENASPESVEAKFPDFMWGYINEEYANYGLSLEPYLQPLQNIHLFHETDSDARRTNLYIFAAVALLILFIACVNFVNLSIARAIKRTREVGVRKVLGADRQKLITQFLGESILLTLIAFLCASFLVEMLFPIYRNLLGAELDFAYKIDVKSVAGVLAILLLVGVSAGSYPAFYMSAFQAISTLKGDVHSGKSKGKARNVLVVLQFAISIALIVCTLLVNGQLNFMKQKELGFNKENIVVLPLVGDEVKLKSETLKQELLRISNVESVAASSEVPHNGFTSNGYFPEGHSKTMMIHVVDIDKDFLETFGIELAQGRNFSKEFATDKTAFLVNESLVRALGWDEPIGRKITRNGEHKIIGIVKDFHFATLHSRIEPLIITNQPWQDRFNNLSVKISSANLPETLAAIKTAWQKIAPATPFDYWFLDETFDRLYKSEQRFQQLFLYFSVLAILIALLGLLSLASFSTEQRTKEIGIRKVLGATVVGVAGMLSKDFLKLVVLANLIAWPVAYYFMSRWLQDFAYRIGIVWWVFFFAGGLALLVALATVGFRAIKAALANPVEALRYE